MKSKPWAAAAYYSPNAIDILKPGYIIDFIDEEGNIHEMVVSDIDLLTSIWGDKSIALVHGTVYPDEE